LVDKRERCIRQKTASEILRTSYAECTHTQADILKAACYQNQIAKKINTTNTKVLEIKIYAQHIRGLTTNHFAHQFSAKAGLIGVFSTVGT
jgi:hypothetical protein